MMLPMRLTARDNMFYCFKSLVLLLKMIFDLQYGAVLIKFFTLIYMTNL